VTAALVRAELTKILSTRLWWALLVGVALYTLVQAGVSAAFAGVDPGPGQPASPGLDSPEALRGVYAGAAFSGAYIFALVLGVTGMTGEYRYETATPTFLATPRRHLVVVAKAVAHLAVGIGYGLVAVVTAVVVGGVVVLVRGHDLGLGADGLGRAVMLAVLAVALWTMVGLGIGTLIRNQVAALLVAVAVTFLVEPLVSIGLYAADLDDVGKFLPSTASSAMTSPPSVLGELLPWWGGALVLGAYAVVFGAAGLWLSVRRDIT
jgi:ABC-type transport system involved in multi-copper enzyme maturation permease subunit